MLLSNHDNSHRMQRYGTQAEETINKIKQVSKHTLEEK